MNRRIEFLSFAATLVTVVFLAEINWSSAAYTSYAQPGYKAAKIHSA